MEKPETSGSPLKVWSWHSTQRVKQCVTRTTEGLQHNIEEHAGNYVHSGRYRQQRLRFSVDNIDGQLVDTPDGMNLFYSTAMPVYHRQPTMDGRAYLTEAQHPAIYLPPTIIIDGMVVVHELNVPKIHIDNCQDLSAFFIRAIDNKSFGYCEAYLRFDD